MTADAGAFSAGAALSTAAQPPAGIWVPTELAERVQETMGEFLMEHGWRQQDMDTSDEFGALLAVATKAEERALERKLSAAKGQITKLRNAAKKEQNHAE